MRAGAINAWRCQKCRRDTVTVHADEGVTPMFLGCRATDGCDGMAVSMGYPDQGNVPDHIRKAVAWEWWRPLPHEAARMSPAMQDHIAQGGLALRPVAAQGGAA